MAKLMLVLSAIMIAVAITYGQVDSWYLVHDGVDRITSLNATNFTSTIQGSPIVIVHFVGDETAGGKLLSINDQMIQLAAQMTQGQGVVAAKVSLVDSPDLAQQEGITKPGSVYVYKGGQKLMFNGYKSGETLVAFINQVNTSPVTIIDGKIQKKAFDKVDSLKVVGFFVPGSPALQAFENAALKFQPDIPFYAVIDPMVAPFLKIAMPGSIHIIKPFDKARYAIPQNPATEADIEAFLSMAAGPPILKTVNKFNLHSVLSDDPTKAHVVALFRRKSPEGEHFYKLLRSMAKHGGALTTTVSILLLDLDEFPSLNNFWQQLNVTLDKPAMGLVNFTDNTAIWLDLTVVNALLTKEEQEAHIRTWMQGVEMGMISFHPQVGCPTGCPSATGGCPQPGFGGWPQTGCPGCQYPQFGCPHPHLGCPHVQCPPAAQEPAPEQPVEAPEQAVPPAGAGAQPEAPSSGQDTVVP